jgi:hypothetical protein
VAKAKDSTEINPSKIRTPRQIADYYKLLRYKPAWGCYSLFNSNELLREFSVGASMIQKIVAWGPGKRIIVEMFLTDKDRAFIERRKNRQLIYDALLDFSDAICISRRIKPELPIKAGKDSKRSVTKDMRAIEGLLESEYVPQEYKRNLTELKEYLGSISYYTPLTPLLYHQVREMGDKPEELVKWIVHHKVDSRALIGPLSLQKGRPSKKALFKAMQIIIYEALAEDENSSLDQSFLLATANIINSFMKKYRDGALADLATISYKTIETTLYEAL